MGRGIALDGGYRALTELGADALLLLTEGLRIVDVNPRAEVLFARGRLEMVGRSYIDFVAADQRENVERNWATLLALGEVRHVRRRLLRPGGESVWVEVSKYGVGLGKGQVMLRLREVTGEKGALRASDQLNASVVSGLQEGIVIADARGRIIACNRSAERILATPEARLLGLLAGDPDWSTFREDGSPMRADERPAVQTLRTGQPCSNVIMGLDRPDGCRIWLSLNTQALRDEVGAVSGVVTSFADISEHRAMEETLHGLSGRLLRLQDEERRRLARDLHDSSGSTLVALTLDLAVLARSNGAYGAREQEALESARRRVVG